MMRWVLSLLLFSSAYATELKPWFGNLWEIEPQARYTYQHYGRVDSTARSFNQTSHDHFLNFSLGMSFWPDWNGELELLFARTRENSFGYEAFQATGRYLFFSDLIGDPLSVAAGVTLAFPNGRFLDDISLFFHGDINAEAHLSLGREISCRGTWITRAYALGGVGIANRGNAWLRAKGCWEWNWFDRTSLGASLDLLYGLGNQPLTLPFNGYAKIRHQTFDLSLFACWPLDVCGTLTLSYTNRLHARNAPENAHLVSFELFLPFGL